MTLFGFIWKNMFRDALRANVSFVAIVLTFFLYVIVRALSGIVDAPPATGTDTRLMVTNRTAIFGGLPESYVADVAAVEGVGAVTPVTFFVGQIPRTRGQVFGLAVDPDSYGSVYQDANITDELLAAWRGDKRAVLVGASLARTRDWRVGDVVSLESLNIIRKDGKRDWQFVVAGTFEAEKGSLAEQAFLAQIGYVTEARLAQGRRYDMLGVRGEPGTDSSALALRIEKAMRFYTPSVRAADENSFVRGMIQQFGNLRQLTFYVLAYALGILFVVLLNGILVSIRARLKEYATLKTIGFTANHLLTLVLAESLLLMVTSALAGAGCALLVLHSAAETINRIFPMALDGPALLLEAVGMSVAIGLAIGLVPALWASRVSVSETLRSA